MVKFVCHDNLRDECGRWAMIKDTEKQQELLNMLAKLDDQHFAKALVLVRQELGEQCHKLTETLSHPTA